MIGPMGPIDVPASPLNIPGGLGPGTGDISKIVSQVIEDQNEAPDGMPSTSIWTGGDSYNVFWLQGEKKLIIWYFWW